MARGSSEAAEIVGERITRRERVRRAHSIEIESALVDVVEGRLDAARPRIEEALGLTLGDREGVGFLRYQTGDFYRPHQDRGRVAGWPDASRRSVTVVVCLNEGSGGVASDFEGGELCIYPPEHDPVQISSETGLLVAFPADLLHEVLPVSSGIRETAIDWFYDR